MVQRGSKSCFSFALSLCIWLDCFGYHPLRAPSSRVWDDIGITLASVHLPVCSCILFYFFLNYFLASGTIVLLSTIIMSYYRCMCSALQLMSDTELPDSWRQLGMEVIVTMSETAPAMVRKYNKFIPMLSECSLYNTDWWMLYNEHPVNHEGHIRAKH